MSPGGVYMLSVQFMYRCSFIIVKGSVGGDFLNLSSNPRSPSMGLDLGVSKRKGVRVNNS